MQSNVLSRRSRPVTKSYRAAVKAIVLNVQAEHGLNDRELADRVGCSQGTIKNARTEAGNLDGVTLANFEYEFGPAALDPFLALGGSRAMPLTISEGGDATAFTSTTHLLHLLAQALDPSSEDGAKLSQGECRQMKPVAVDVRHLCDLIIQRADGAAVRGVAA